MKKTYILTVDYDESAKSICESFGTSLSELLKFQTKILTSGKNTYTKSLIYLLDNNEVEGGVVLASASMYVYSAYERALFMSAKKGMEIFLKQMLDDTEEGRE